MSEAPKIVGAHFLWCRTEEEYHELKKLGWDIAEQRATHHGHHAVLLRWNGKGDPKVNQP